MVSIIFEIALDWSMEFISIYECKNESKRIFRWWQIYTGGMMAIPLSAIRKYTPEIIALSVVAVILGAFWSIIDTFQPPYLIQLNDLDAPLVIKLALTGLFNVHRPR